MTVRTARGDETRREILAAAADLFHKQGVVATSPDQIIDASGTGKGQFYHYFKNKEASFTRLCRPTSRRFGVEVARSATTSRHGMISSTGSSPNVHRKRGRRLLHAFANGCTAMTP